MRMQLELKNRFITNNGAKVYLDHTNKRIKILHHQRISDSLIKDIIQFARSEGIGKIISNCHINQLRPFISNGFVIEGFIKEFFCGEDAICASYFVDAERQISTRKDEENMILQQSTGISDNLLQKGDQFKVRTATPEDIPEMIKLFASVFESYPSPVFSAEYLVKAMSENVIFKVAEENGMIISIASADMDKINMNAEITDCATYPAYRGKGLLRNIISSLESELKDSRFRSVYSLSRAINPGINIALGNLNYRYSGRLVNNCHICGGFEDMNIWVKKLN